MIHLSNLSFKYNSSPKNENILILKDINIRFISNTITSILGPSGCGKSTLLNLISGLIQPIEGSIHFNLKSNEKPRFGYVFQSPSLIPWKTVKENVLIGAKVSGLINQNLIDRANQLLENYGLIDYSDKFPTSISGGMQQRVSFIRAVLSGANILLLDEPYSNSDYKLRKELQENLSDFVGKESLVAILVTHDVLEAVRLGDQIVILSNRPASVADSFSIPIPRTERMQSNQLLPANLLQYVERINNLLTK